LIQTREPYHQHVVQQIADHYVVKSNDWS